MSNTMSSTLKVDVPEGASFLTISREFDAPPEAVFRAMTDPELIPQWWGPARYTTEVTELTPHTGGSWRFVQRGDDGEFGFRGVFHEVVPAERIIQTFEFEPMPGHVILETMTFEDLGGRTRISGSSAFQTVEDRDGMVAAGMEGGLAEGYDRLDDLLAQQA